MRTPATANADAQALSMVHRANRAQIALGLFGQEKAENPKVRSFGQRMAVDYRDSDIEIAALAKQLGVAVSLQKDDKDKLPSATTQHPDSDFLGAVVDRHRAAIAGLRAEKTKVSQDVVRNFIDRTLLVWEQRMATAVDLQQHSPEK